MNVDDASLILDQPEQAAAWLRSLGIEDTRRGRDNLSRIQQVGVPVDLVAEICRQLSESLSLLSDADMALNNLERFVCSQRSPLSLATLFERDPSALPSLLQIFSTSQYLSDLLISDNESYDHLRITDGRPVMRDDLVAELDAEVRSLNDPQAVMAALRRFKRRETLRIAYGDIVRNQKLDTVTRQISYLADAIVTAAVNFARRRLEEKRGVPMRPDGKAAGFVVLALGKLGGVELNYSSDIDLICLYETDGQVSGPRSQTNGEFFGRLTGDFVKLITESTELGTTYRVDLRLRPDGAQGAAALSVDAALQYYDNKGRTWERQAMIKARPIAGDLQLGKRFLAELEPWIFRRFLSRADMTGIKSLKRRIEKRTEEAGDDLRHVKTGHGGIRDIEFVIQFLQLINAGDLPALRTGNTLEAIARLEAEGCLSHQEQSLLTQNYTELRKIEHRLQMMFDLQTHLLPTDENELRKLAIRLGYHGTPHTSALEAFQRDYRRRTEENRKILDHLLHESFGADEVEPEVDLVNDPAPSPEQIEQVLGGYGFHNTEIAYRNLMELADEKIRFLSTRRCRMFLASIAPRLLREVAETPDPDSTLVNLSKVSDSLGGKSALWELFSVNHPSLNLYVTLCAACPYLASILTSNPGLIDELTDSLLLDKLPTLDMLELTLADLCHHAEDIDPILHSFKDSQHLRVGVRDILGRDDIKDNHAALSDIAEACLKRITHNETKRLMRKFGEPTLGEDVRIDGKRPGDPCELIILALGKLGGREPNYHSDLDIVFLYEGDGSTTAGRRGERAQTTNNVHFFSELGQRIIKSANRLGPHGRLFEVDPRLRPTGRSGSLAVPLDEFRRYFASGGGGQLWERQALCKARVIYGSHNAARRAMEAATEAAFGRPWKKSDAAEIRAMRVRLEQTASDRNLKRGIGGTVDIEFLVQMLQLRHGGRHPEIRTPGTLDALAALYQTGLLEKEDFVQLSQNYRFQRRVEARIRLMNAAGRHELPLDETEKKRLAYLLGESDPVAVERESQEVSADNRRRFNRIFDEVIA